MPNRMERDESTHVGPVEDVRDGRARPSEMNIHDVSCLVCRVEAFDEGFQEGKRYMESARIGEIT